MNRFVRYGLPLMSMAVSFLGEPVLANWQRTSTRVVKETFLDRGVGLKFDPQSINAVAAQGILSNQDLMTNGSWNKQNTFGVQTAGQEFTLKLHEKTAGPMPSDMNQVLQTPASEVTLWDTPNKLDARITSSGDLKASSGSAASKVELLFSQTYSVFNPN